MQKCFKVQLNKEADRIISHKSFEIDQKKYRLLFFS